VPLAAAWHGEYSDAQRAPAIPAAPAIHNGQTKESEMKKAVLVLLICMVAGGCSTMTHYHRQVVVKKDGSGKIIEIIDTEEINQPNRQEPAQGYKYIN
jgi:hypothetical protein